MHLQILKCFYFCGIYWVWRRKRLVNKQPASIRKVFRLSFFLHFVSLLVLAGVFGVVPGCTVFSFRHEVLYASFQNYLRKAAICVSSVVRKVANEVHVSTVINAKSGLVGSTFGTHLHRKNGYRLHIEQKNLVCSRKSARTQTLSTSLFAKWSVLLLNF